MADAASLTPAESSFAGGAFRLRVACLALALLACAPGWVQLRFLWERSDYLGHAYLIPLTAIFLAYSRRDALLSALRAGEVGAFGVIAVFAASLLEASAVLARSASIAGLGIPVLLGATLYALGGQALLRGGVRPLLFLLLMVPPPPSVQDRLLIGLKALVVSVSVNLLQHAGFTIAAVGNRILMPQSELLVADACSGLTSLVTLAPLAFVVAYFLSRGVWRRALIVLSVVPIALAGNIARVILTVALVSRYGVGYAEGLLHESFGLATFVLGTLLLVGFARVLR